MNLTLNFKRLSKGLSIMGIAALCALSILFVQTLFPTKAYATSTTFSIPVEQIFGVTPADVEREGTFSYEMRRLDSASPLPAGYTGDVFSFTLTGNDTRNLGPLTFARAGEFAYEIRAVGTAGERYLFDDTIYTVIIGVTNVPGGGLRAEIRVIYTRTPTDPVNAKVESDRIVFEKGYEGEILEIDPPPEVLPETPPGETTPPPPGAGVTTPRPPTQGPKTGDYADPMAMLFAMGISAVIALFVVFLMYMDRKNEEELDDIELVAAKAA